MPEFATKTEAVAHAIEAIRKYAESAEADAGFDAGEFSGLANARALARELRQIAFDAGLSMDELYAAIEE